MTNDIGKASLFMLKDAVVGFMLSRIDRSYEEICELMTEFPKTRLNRSFRVC